MYKRVGLYYLFLRVINVPNLFQLMIFTCCAIQVLHTVLFSFFQNANSCPVDRIVFKSICLRKCYGGKVQKVVSIYWFT